MASKVARLTDSVETAAVTLLSQIHSRTAEPSELLPPADNTDFCAAAHHIYGRLRRPVFFSCVSDSVSYAHSKIRSVCLKSANFLRSSLVVAVATQSTPVSCLGLSARFMNHTPRNANALLWHIGCKCTQVHSKENWKAVYGIRSNE
jgi:hypothetical protein